MTTVGPTNLDPSDLAALRVITGLYDASYPADVLGPQTPPTLSALTPASIVVNTPTLVHIDGTGFTHASVVLVDGVAQHTTYVFPTRVDYMAEASSVGTQDVRVRNGQSAPSSALTLTVTATTRGEVVGESADSNPTAATPRRRGNGKPKGTEEASGTEGEP